MDEYTRRIVKQRGFLPEPSHRFGLTMATAGVVALGVVGLFMLKGFTGWLIH